jgi:hypothetical protein
MKAFLSLFLVVFAVVITTPAASAQINFTATAGGAIATGDLEDFADTGFALDFTVGVPVTESLNIIGNSGYHRFTSTDFIILGEVFDIEAGFVPLRIGIQKYWGSSKRFYTSPGIGAYIPSDDLENFDTRFGFGGRVGYQFPIAEKADFDIGVSFHSITTEDDNLFTDGDAMRYVVISGGLVFGKVR